MECVPPGPTAAPTPTPTTSPTPVQLSVVQSLSGVSAANFDTSAQNVFKTAVAQVLSAYGVQSSDVIITSFSNARRILNEIQSRILSGALQVSYTVNLVAQSAGFTSSSSAATAVTSTLTAAVQSSTFNTALNAAAVSSGNTQMQSVTSSSTISVSDTTPSGAPTKAPTAPSGISVGAIIGIAVGVFVLGLFGGYLGYRSFRIGKSRKVVVVANDEKP